MTMRTLLDRVASLPVPVVAALNGHAFGGGCEVAIACDFRLAADDVKLAFNQVDLAIMPAWGGIERLQAVVGRGRALYLLTTGLPIDAPTAADWGLVEQVVPRSEFDDRLTELLERIARAPATPWWESSPPPTPPPPPPAPTSPAPQLPPSPRPGWPKPTGRPSPRWKPAGRNREKIPRLLSIPAWAVRSWGERPAGSRSGREEIPMTQYLLSVWMTEGVEPYATKEEMEQAFADVDKFNQEIQASGHWVFAGGLHPADTATVVRRRRQGRRGHHRRPVRRDEGAARRVLGHRGQRPRRGPRYRRPGLRGLPGRGRGASLPGASKLGRRGRGHRGDLPGRVRPECGHPGPPLRQHRHRRRGGPGRLRRGHRTVAVHRPAPEPGGLDHHHRPQPGHRPAPPRELTP